MSKIAKLALEDGTVFTGKAFGATGTTTGEVVFNTSMTGYQETLTDPSYKGQIVTMTYPLIGNYGITTDDDESQRPQVEGFIVRELTPLPSNFRSQIDLDGYLKKNNIIGLEKIDTRALVRRLRVRGSLTGVLSTEILDDVELTTRAAQLPGMTGQDMVKKVLPEKAFSWDKEGLLPLAESMMMGPQPTTKRHVVALDYGMKWNIARCLTQSGCRVTVVPGTAKAEDILALKPDGIFLSNGPGDPAALGGCIETLQELIGKRPIFGICLGHQLLGLALGGKTFKLKFGHRGSNQPVLNQITGKVEITTQNHGFAVDANSLPSEVEATHINLNDQTLEGLRHKKLPVFSVQYHPEASAGPHDSSYLFEDFWKMMG
ncbi:glutamine-hydrolyzing carbamoyl-phosphate synthase small subunit [Telmatocola sphagniphila]|uniref:Carbamoyl phosphate synthase small chain n=1 Tax=Telmatocola sphagniphila TaxID=1123043 RepID=A0A8E6F0A5_9BACT|nr:glutamine-hydrolyzing carbamoyl-phosphate synthase small subunit [Telmatocola sphagniphila]QVL34598.1 glutamine-hydrolyzing carbamoyl-phosphate synthase small subunit [Telmatocola sphagniphila]